MLKFIINYKRERIISILIDIASAIFINLIFFNNNVVKNQFYFYILALPIWIFISYIFGRYHEFRKIGKKYIIKNFFKTIFTSFILINICLLLERVIYINSLNSIKNLSLFLLFLRNFQL